MATKKRATKVAKKAPAKKAAKKWAKKTPPLKVRVTNPSFEKKDKRELEVVQDSCNQATEREPTEYEQGFEAGKREQRKNSIDGDVAQLEGLQSALTSYEETYALQRSIYLEQKARMLETESSIVRVRGNIRRIQDRVGAKAAFAMRPA